MAGARDDTHRIAMFSGGLYASPAYVARRGAPPEPEALMEHDTLRVLSRTGDPLPRVLTRGAQRRQGARPVAPPPARLSP